MINISDRNHKPTAVEIAQYIDNPLFTQFLERMESGYAALTCVEYSGDKVLLGWNMRFYKSGRTLVRLYPRRGYYTVLVVVGRRERERVEALLNGMSESLRTIYQNTKKGMGQRWLLIDLNADDELYRDVLTLIDIRRSCK